MVVGYTKCGQADIDETKLEIKKDGVVVIEVPPAQDDWNGLKDGGANGYEPPPQYREKDPLQTSEGSFLASFSRTSTAVTISTESTDSFSGDGEEEVTAAESGTGQNWSDLTRCEQLMRVLKYTGKAIALPLLLYIFICSLDFLSSSFRILGGKTAGGVFTNSTLLCNPVAGLMIGILATVLVQSSSTSTSIIVTMVASGIIEVEPAIPIIMGANIGTSVTNTFVSMAQSTDREEFRRAFAGATVHDMFNWLTVLTLLPLEWATGYLYHLTKLVIGYFNIQTSKGAKRDILKALTKPLTSLVVKVDKNVITKIAEGHEEYKNKSLIKKYCVYEEREVTKMMTSETNMTSNVSSVTIVEKLPVGKCFSLFSHLDINETLAGVILLLFSLIVLCACLVSMVKLLKSILNGPIAKLLKKTINSDFPKPFSWLTGYVAMVLGMIMTLLVQSSSVFTSALTPLVGVGMIKLERMYPLTLGSNIGTTGTGLLAAMAASGDKLPIALQIAFCHLFFNISGIILFYPVPALRKLPIKAAKFLGNVTAEYRWFALAYLILMFLLLPASVFMLSLAGFIPSIVVASVVIPLIQIIIIMNILQRKKPDFLPKRLQTWEFLPKYLRSLEPIDTGIMKVLSVMRKGCPCCIKCCQEQRKPEKITAKVLENKMATAASAASSRLLLDPQASEI